MPFQRNVNVEYLVHIMLNGIVNTSLGKTEAVRKFPVSKNVYSFIRLTSHFRKCIQNYAVKAKPLCEFLKKCKFHFNEEQRLACEKLNDTLCNDPVFKVFDI